MTAKMVPWPDDPGQQERVAALAAEVLARGRLVVYPTDTVYGLGADAANPLAIERIYQVKGRSDEKAIIWLVDALGAVELTCKIDDRARRLAEAFWPGALTLILQRRESAPGELSTLGVRVPRHEAALAIIRALGRPVATTSANRSGEPSARNAEEAARQIGAEVDLIISAGDSPVGQESTVLDLTTDPPRVLRAGALSTEAIESVLGRPTAGGAP
jgi:L-threonylcarbamoyladenylate synthase